MGIGKSARKILGVVQVSSHGLQDDERAFVRDWARERTGHLMSVLGRLAIGVSLAAAVASALLPPPSMRPMLVATYGLVFVLLLFWRFSLERRLRDARYFFYGIEVFMVAANALALRHGFMDDPSPTVLVFQSNVLLATSVFGVLLCPFPNAAILGSALLYLGLGSLAWGGQAEAGTWFMCEACFLSLAACLEYARVHRIRREALTEMQTRRLIAQNERLRADSMEKELQVAREIQDSLAPPPALVQTSRLSAHFYQLKHSTLGGDWMASRELASGDLAIVVADATGKGVQAALVIHAVQSLWAHALADAEFDPEAWIHAVNRTLIALGKRKAHSMSLGLALISATRLKYFSAGHTPAFVLAGTGEQATLTPVVARGNLLGLAPELQLEAKELDLTGLPDHSLLFGTDGVFDKGVRINKKTVLSLLGRVAKDGDAGLSECPAEDDKLLVWIKKAG